MDSADHSARAVRLHDVAIHANACTDSVQTLDNAYCCGSQHASIDAPHAHDTPKPA